MLALKDMYFINSQHLCQKRRFEQLWAQRACFKAQSKCRRTKNKTWGTKRPFQSPKQVQMDKKHNTLHKVLISNSRKKQVTTLGTKCSFLRPGKNKSPRWAQSAHLKNENVTVVMVSRTREACIGLHKIITFVVTPLVCHSFWPRGWCP